jgi:hypothetical protein
MPMTPMTKPVIFQNAAGGWTLVDVPEDGPDGNFYSSPHSPDRHFNTKDEAMKALVAMLPLPADDAN